MAAPPFVAFGRDHLAADAVVAAATVAAVVWARRVGPARAARGGRLLGAILIAYYLVECVLRVRFAGLPLVETLPIHICSILFFVGAWAYLRGSQLAFDLLYFWTFAGTAHALVTPSSPAGFPDLRYFLYFACHGGLVLSACYAAFGMGRGPTRGSLLRAFVALQAWVLVAVATNAIFTTNFLYLRAKPDAASLFDVLGPWPWYLLSLEGVALGSFLVWGAPWTIARWRRERRLPPGPRAPAIVQLMQFARQPFDFYEKCARKFGDTFTVDMGTFGRFVMVSSPELVKRVFTADPDELPAGRANRSLEPFVGPRSLFLLDGAEHLRMRRLLLPPFHGERMHAYALLMGEITDAALDAMPVGEPFALMPHMKSITLDVILRAVFGLDEGAEMKRLAGLLVEYLEPPSPILLFLPQVNLPGSPYRRFLRRRDAMDREIYRILAERRAATDGAARTDILSLLLAAKDEQGRALDDGELRDELVTLLVAGHETTTTALAWAFERILIAPKVAERLSAEVAGARDAAALAELPWLDAVVKEVLRMRQILPSVVRSVEKPFALGKWEVPVGLHVAPCMHLAHLREESWPEPGRFDPERFIDKKVDPYAWLPFGGGTRRCIGMAFALHEMKIVLGTMLARARFSLEGGRPLGVVRNGVTLAPAGGTRVTLIERRALSLPGANPATAG